MNEIGFCLISVLFSCLVQNFWNIIAERTRSEAAKPHTCDNVYSLQQLYFFFFLLICFELIIF